MEENKNPAVIGRETITATQAAEIIGCSYWKLNEMCKASIIPYISVGSRRLFRKTTLTRWMENQEAVSTNKHIETNTYEKLRKFSG